MSSDASRRDPPAGSGLTPYLFMLGALLALSSFYDAFATTFRYSATTYVRQDFGISFSEITRLFTWLYLGSCLAFVPRWLADVYGRRWMLWISFTGMCGLQWLVGFSRGPVEYVATLTLLAIFYKSDVWMLVASEEAPPKLRARFIAIISGLGATGAMVLGLLIARMGDDPAAWRGVAQFPVWGLIASLPMLLLTREPKLLGSPRSIAGGRALISSLLRPFRRSLARALWLLTALKIGFAGVAMGAMALISIEYLRVEHGYAPADIGRVVFFKVPAVVLAWIVVGAMADRWGRRPTVYVAGALYLGLLVTMAFAPRGGTMVAYAYVAQDAVSIGLFGILRVATMELLPNDCRATGSAWTDLFMTFAASVTAQLLGFAAAGEPGGLGWSLSACILAVAAVAAFVLPLFALLPETRGRRLEQV